MIETADVATRLEEVRRRIASAGRDPRDVRIVAVTKKFGADAISAAIECGIGDIGENYAQEARAKADFVTRSAAAQPTWHFIGGLQRNKVKMLASFTDVYQSVDSTSLVDEIAKRAPGARILVQVDLSDDPGRGGASWADVPVIVTHARDNGLGVAGLMGVAPNAGPGAAREPFRRLAGTAAEHGLAEVSMGMSNDLEIAVEEGSTTLRLGTALFGPRGA